LSLTLLRRGMVPARGQYRREAVPV